MQAASSLRRLDEEFVCHGMNPLWSRRTCPLCNADPYLTNFLDVRDHRPVRRTSTGSEGKGSVSACMVY